MYKRQIQDHITKSIFQYNRITVEPIEDSIPAENIDEGLKRALLAFNFNVKDMTKAVRTDEFIDYVPAPTLVGRFTETAVNLVSPQTCETRQLLLAQEPESNLAAAYKQFALSKAPSCPITGANPTLDTVLRTAAQVGSDLFVSEIANFAGGEMAHQDLSLIHI